MDRRLFLKMLGGGAAVAAAALVAPPELWDSEARFEDAEPLQYVRDISPIGALKYGAFGWSGGTPSRVYAEALRRAEYQITDGGRDGTWQIVNVKDVQSDLTFSTYRYTLWRKVAM